MNMKNIHEGKNPSNDVIAEVHLEKFWIFNENFKLFRQKQTQATFTW